MVIIPSCFEIDRSEWEKRKGLGLLYSDNFFNKNTVKFSDMFTQFGKDKSIATLPLLPIFRHSKVRPLYFTRDAHWTREGHRLAAEAIYNYIKKENPNLLYISSRHPGQ